eukprot:4345831-Pleurochrysis_carterae.AAC.1
MEDSAPLTFPADVSPRCNPACMEVTKASLRASGTSSCCFACMHANQRCMRASLRVIVANGLIKCSSKQEKQDQIMLSRQVGTMCVFRMHGVHTPRGHPLTLGPGR